MTRASGTSYYTPGKLFNDSFLNSNSGGAKLYPAGYNVGTSSPEKYKNVQINSSGIKLFK